MKDIRNVNLKMLELAPKEVRLFYDDCNEIEDIKHMYLTHIIDFLNIYRFGDYEDNTGLPRDVFFVEKEFVEYYFDRYVENTNDKVLIASTLNVFFRYLEKKYHIIQNPMKNLFQFDIELLNYSVPDTLSFEQISILLNNITEIRKDEYIDKFYEREVFIERDYCIISFLLFLGIEPNEIHLLSIDDVDLDSRTIKLPKGRVVHFGDNMYFHLNKYLMWREDRLYCFDKQENALFISKKNSRMRFSLVERVVYSHSSYLLPIISPYVLHRTCVKMIFDFTRDIKKTAEILGYKNARHVSDILNPKYSQEEILKRMDNWI